MVGGDCECDMPGAPAGHLTLRGTRCIVRPLPRTAAVDLMGAAMVVGVAAAPIRPQARFPCLSPSLVPEVATAMAAMSATIPSSGSMAAREEASVMTPIAGSAEVPATLSAKASIPKPPVVPAVVIVATPAARSTTASIETFKAVGPSPGSGVAVREARSSVSRVAPAVTMKVDGRTVTSLEVAVVSLYEYECVTASPKPAAAVMAMTAAAVLAAVVAAPAPLLPQAAYGPAQPPLWCPAMWQAANPPKAHLRAARLSPATKLMGHV